MIPDSDTGLKVLPVGLPAALPRMARTGFANLRRDRVSGMYFCHAKVCGRLVRESLHTRSLTIAKRNLDEVLARRRAEWTGREKRPVVENFRMQALLTAFEAEIEAERKLKPRSKKYRRATLKCLRKEWPKLAELRPHKVTPEAVQAWVKDFRAQGYSSGFFNSTVDSLRMVMDMAVERHLVARNPVAGIEKEIVPRREKALPSIAQMAALWRAFRAKPGRRRAFWFVRVLAYSGQRPESVRTLLPRHVNLAENLISWPPIKHNREFNVVPMHRQLRLVMRELLAAHPGGEKPLLPIKSARKALAAACAASGILPPLTEGAFRHWFTTRALEENIPVPDVAAMRGDRDGGAMLLRTYKHKRLEHLRAQVAKL